MAAVSAYVAKFTPDMADIWSAGELRILVKKAMPHPYTFMDHGTRWLLGAWIAGTKHTASTAPVARAAAGNVPEARLWDGPPA